MKKNIILWFGILFSCTVFAQQLVTETEEIPENKNLSESDLSISDSLVLPSANGNLPIQSDSDKPANAEKSMGEISITLVAPKTITPGGGGIPFCTSHIRIKNGLDIPVKNISFRLNYKEGRKAPFRFSNIPAKGQPQEFFGSIGEICHDIFEKPTVTVSSCNIEGIDLAECQQMVKFYISAK